MSTPRPLRVAIAHDYLTQRGGAERVVLALLRAFPGAKLYTSFYHPEETYPEFADYDIMTSALDRLPILRRNHRLAFPFLRWGMDRFGYVPCDVLIASSSGWGHAFRTRGKTIVYCHSPARWLYQPQLYIGGSYWSSPKGWVLRVLRRPLYRWDRAKAAQADRYLANSRIVAHRIDKAYGITAEVLPPPFGVDPDGPRRSVNPLEEWAAQGYLLVVSRLLPYKNVTAAVAAVSGTDHRLVVVGSGPLKDEILATLPDNVRLVSDLDDAQMRWVYEHATALVAPSHEDFGLTPLEAGIFGHPTIALRGGGYLDTVVEGETGVFFPSPEPAAIRAAIDEATARTWDTDAIRRHAESFSEAAFAARLHDIVADLTGA